MADTDKIPQVRLTLFTIDEANRTAAQIRPEVEALVQDRRALGKLQARVEVLELASAGASADNPDALESKSLAVHREALVERIRHGIDRIQRRGCLVKDLERGLVDFYSLSGDRLILLCWQISEPQVAHWHSLDGGFASRRPVPRESD